MPPPRSARPEACGIAWARMSGRCSSPPMPCSSPPRCRASGTPRSSPSLTVWRRIPGKASSSPMACCICRMRSDAALIRRPGQPSRRTAARARDMSAVALDGSRTGNGTRAGRSAISVSVAAVIACMLAITVFATSVSAQSPDYGILTYTGSDRTEKLIEGAKKEAQVTYYSGMIVNQALRPLTAAFQKKYPFIKMAYWRGDSEDIESKLSAEMRANNPVVDVVEGTGIGELAVRAGLAQPVSSPLLADIPERMRDPRRLWVPTRMSYFAIAYNTRLVAADVAPKTYQDLLD